MTVRPTETQKELGHMLLVGRTRGGKGLNIETQLYTWPYSVIVNDIKGELYQRTAGYRATLGDVFVFDPSSVINRYDPLAGRNNESALRSAAHTLLYRPNEGENKVFTSRATTMLLQIFAASKLENQRCLPFTYKIINEGLVGVAQMLDYISRNHNYYPNLATKFLDTRLEDADFKDKFLLSCFGTLCERINAIINRESVECFRGSDFIGEKIITSKKPVTVYLRWPERDVLSLSHLIHLVWNSLIDEMVYTYDTLNSQCYPVLAVLDEIGRTGFPNLPEYSATTAGRGISLLPVFQSLSQMDAAFGRDKAKTIRANMDTQIFYRPSDHETAKELEEYLGYKSGFAASRSENDHGGSKGESETRIPLMTAHEIKLMPEWEILGFRSGMRPFRLKRLDYRRFPMLLTRAGIPPLFAFSREGTSLLTRKPIYKEIANFMPPQTQAG
jgi:type IV secretion system protein VirD4